MGTKFLNLSVAQNDVLWNAIVRKKGDNPFAMRTLIESTVNQGLDIVTAWHNGLMCQDLIEMEGHLRSRFYVKPDTERRARVTRGDTAMPRAEDLEPWFQWTSHARNHYWRVYEDGEPLYTRQWLVDTLFAPMGIEAWPDTMVDANGREHTVIRIPVRIGKNRAGEWADLGFCEPGLQVIPAGERSVDGQVYDCMTEPYGRLVNKIGFVDWVVPELEGYPDHEPAEDNPYPGMVVRHLGRVHEIHPVLRCRAASAYVDREVARDANPGVVVLTMTTNYEHADPEDATAFEVVGFYELLAEATYRALAILKNDNRTQRRSLIASYLAEAVDKTLERFVAVDDSREARRLKANTLEIDEGSEYPLGLNGRIGYIFAMNAMAYKLGYNPVMGSKSKPGTVAQWQGQRSMPAFLDGHMPFLALAKLDTLLREVSSSSQTAMEYATPPRAGKLVTGPLGQARSRRPVGQPVFAMIGDLRAMCGDNEIDKVMHESLDRIAMFPAGVPHLGVWRMVRRQVEADDPELERLLAQHREEDNFRAVPMWKASGGGYRKIVELRYREFHDARDYCKIVVVPVKGVSTYVPWQPIAWLPTGIGRRTEIGLSAAPTGKKGTNLITTAVISQVFEGRVVAEEDELDVIRETQTRLVELGAHQQQIRDTKGNLVFNADGTPTMTPSGRCPMYVEREKGQYQIPLNDGSVVLADPLLDENGEHVYAICGWVEAVRTPHDGEIMGDVKSQSHGQGQKVSPHMARLGGIDNPVDPEAAKKLRQLMALRQHLMAELAAHGAHRPAPLNPTAQLTDTPYSDESESEW